MLIVLKYRDNACSLQLVTMGQTQLQIQQSWNQDLEGQNAQYAIQDFERSVNSNSTPQLDHSTSKSRCPLYT